MNKRRTLIQTVVLFCFVPFFLIIHCSTENPFELYSTARTVIRSSLHNNDTVGIFATEILNLVLTNPAKIENVSLHVDSNRYFIDTVISQTLFDKTGPVQFNFKISFFDTGWHGIGIVTRRKNGEDVYDKILVYARQTLVQKSVNGILGDTIRLSATPVKDSDDVKYQWIFGDNLMIESANPDRKEIIKGNYTQGVGLLRVTEIKGSHSSPYVRFQYKFSDETPPEILCVNEGFVGKDTIASPDSEFYLRVNVLEDGSGVTVAANSANLIKKVDSLYVYKVSGLNENNNFVSVVIYAVNSFGKKSNKTFYIKFDSTASKSNIPIITFDAPKKDSIESNRKSYTVMGRIKNYSEVSQNYVLKIKINGKDYSLIDTLSVCLQEKMWAIPIILQPGVNRIEVIAEDLLGNKVVSNNATIIYNQNSTDIAPPELVEISSDQNVSTNGKLIVQKSDPKIRIVTYDEGSGVKEVIVNGVDAVKNDSINNFSWETSVNVIHKEDCKIHIKILDSLNNPLDTSVIIQNNQPPIIKSYPVGNQSIAAGTLFKDSIIAFDPNGDSLKFTKILGPDSLNITQNGYISCQTKSSDTGNHNVIIRIDDGYDYLLVNFNLTVVPKLFQQLRLKTSERDFPAIIETNDTFKMQIQVDSVTGRPPYTITCNLKNSAFKNGILQWCPVITDTGVINLTISADDALGKSCTINPTIRVIPSRETIELKRIWTGNVSETGTLRINRIDNKKDTLIYQIDNDTYQNFRGYTVKIIDNDSLIETSRFNGSGACKLILQDFVENTMSDSIGVMISDTFGHNLTINEKFIRDTLNDPTIISPHSDSIVTDSLLELKWRSSGPNVSYVINFGPIDSSQVYLSDTLIDTSLNIKVRKSGLYFATIAVGNGKLLKKTTAIFRVQLEKKNLTGYFLDSIPHYITIGSKFKARIAVDGNCGPYTFVKEGQFSNQYVLNNAGTIEFEAKETGVCSLRVLIVDSCGNQFALETRTFWVVPQNRPCTIEMTPNFNDTIYVADSTMVLKFKIIDQDTLISEHYKVNVRLFNTESSMELDTSRTFQIQIHSQSTVKKDDSLRVDVIGNSGIDVVVNRKIAFKNPDLSIVSGSPTDEVIKIAQPESLMISWTLSDTSRNDALFELLFDTTSTFANNIKTPLENKPSTMVFVEPGKTYYWQIIIEADGKNAYSRKFSFTTELSDINQ